MGRNRKTEVFRELHFIDRLSKNLVRLGMERYGLKDIGHPYILKVLVDSGEEGLVVSQNKFAKKLMITPAAVAQSIKRMEKEGLITKNPDENDLRVNRITITEKGRAYKKRMDQGMFFSAETFFDGFSNDEIEQMHNYAHRIIKNIIGFQENYQNEKENEH
jgi:DNA-binding MarR family transcriptional regulator